MYRCKLGHLNPKRGVQQRLDGSEVSLCVEVVETPCDMTVTMDGREVGKITSWTGWCMEECQEVQP